VRYSSKFLGKYFKDEDHYFEVLSSIKERCAVVSDELQLSYGCLAITQFYPDINSGDARTLFNFLRTVHKVPFHSLLTKMVRNINA
jgi:hypothetical protein